MLPFPVAVFAAGGGDATGDGSDAGGDAGDSVGGCTSVKLL